MRKYWGGVSVKAKAILVDPPKYKYGPENEHNMASLKFRLQSEHVSLCVVNTKGILTAFFSHCGCEMVCGIVSALVGVQSSC